MDEKKYHYAPVSVALEQLKEKGYTIDFNLHDDAICANSSLYIIDHIYKYEGASDPGDEATVYGIRSTEGLKGVYVAGDSTFVGQRASKVLSRMLIDRQK